MLISNESNRGTECCEGRPIITQSYVYTVAIGSFTVDVCRRFGESVSVEVYADISQSRLGGVLWG